MGGVTLEDFLDRPYFPALVSAQFLPVSSQLYRLFPQPLFRSRTYSLDLVLTKNLQRVTCFSFPFAHGQIIQEAKVLELKGPEVRNRTKAAHKMRFVMDADPQGLGKILATCQL